MWKVNRGDETPEQLAALRRQRQRMLLPGNEMGGVVTITPEVFRSAECAVQLAVTRVFSTGVQFQFGVVVRQQSPRQPGQRPTLPPILGLGRSGDDALWVGVELADGRKATNAGGQPPSVDLPPDAVTLTRTKGTSDGNAAALTYFLSPAPPPGALTVVLAWPVFGVGESKMVIPGDELAAAATRIVTLWPEQPEDERFNAVRPPQPPSGGWFEQNPSANP